MPPSRYWSFKDISSLWLTRKETHHYLWLSILWGSQGIYLPWRSASESKRDIKKEIISSWHEDCQHELSALRVTSQMQQFLFLWHNPHLGQVGSILLSFDFTWSATHLYSFPHFKRPQSQRSHMSTRPLSKKRKLFFIEQTHIYNFWKYKNGKFKRTTRKDCFAWGKESR
jgi:hypothetical protein